MCVACAEWVVLVPQDVLSGELDCEPTVQSLCVGVMDVCRLNVLVVGDGGSRCVPSPQLCCLSHKHTQAQHGYVDVACSVVLAHKATCKA